MVDKKQPGAGRRAGRSGSVRSAPGSRRGVARSPPPLPPRWGEGVAPPSSPVKCHTLDSQELRRSKRRRRRGDTNPGPGAGGTLPLSYPSPPLRPATQPLTSTFVSSPVLAPAPASYPPPPPAPPSYNQHPHTFFHEAQAEKVHDKSDAKSAGGNGGGGEWPTVYYNTFEGSKKTLIL